MGKRLKGGGLKPSRVSSPKFTKKKTWGIGKESARGVWGTRRETVARTRPYTANRENSGSGWQKKRKLTIV